MHIAFWSPGWPLEKFQNGIVTYVHCMKTELERRGHRVSVFTGNLDGPKGTEGVIRVERPRWNRTMNRIMRRSVPAEIFEFPKFIAAAIAREHSRHPIDVLEIEESFGWCAGVQRLVSVPVVVKLHGPAFLTLAEGDVEAAFAKERIDREGRALKECSTIVSPSQYTLAQTCKRYALPSERITVVPNPLITDLDIPSWKIDGCDRQTILFVGRFDHCKGADVLLNAFLIILRVRPGAKLIMVGPDPGISSSDGSRTHFAAYRDMLFPPELRHRIEFRGSMRYRDILNLRVRAMVTVVTSRSESQGYALLEAMLQACPVVSTDAGALVESITHEVTGRLARSTDPGDVAAQILALLDDPDGARILGEAARRRVIERHSPGAVVEAMLKIYKSVGSRADRKTQLYPISLRT